MDILGCKYGIENQKRAEDRNVFCNWHNVEVNGFPGTVHTSFYLDRPLWGPEYKECRGLMVPYWVMFCHHSDLALRHQPHQGFVWSIAVI